jgi:hypothetical protein
MLTSYVWGHIEANDYLFEAVFHDGTPLLSVRNPVSGGYFIVTRTPGSVAKQVWRDIMEAHAKWLKEKAGD